MPTISEAVQKSQQLQAQGKSSSSPVEPQNANIPPASDGTGINGPARGGYLPGQVFDSDVMATGPMGGSAPMRSRVFPFIPSTTAATATGNTTSQQIAEKAIALASEKAITLPKNIVTTSGVGQSLQTVGGQLVVEDQMNDGIQFARVTTSALSQNRIDPTKSGVLMKGSVPPMYSGAFTYTATTTSITISWNNLVVYRSDGTTTNVGSGSQSVTGLSAGETYNFLGYWDEATSTLDWVSSSSLINPLTAIIGATFTTTGTPGWVSSTSSLTRPSSVSAECWFHCSSDSVQCPLLEFCTNQTGLPGTSDFDLSLNTGPIAWSPGTTAIQSPGSYTDGNWHYVVGTYDGTTAILYVDGVQVATGSVTASGSFSGFWRLLSEGAATTTGVTLAHTAIYSALVLSATQVANHFNSMLISGVTTYSANVLADGATYYWKLVETSGSTATDSSDSNTGTYQNTGSIALNQSQQVDSSLGSPSIAWLGVPVQAVQVAVLQGNISLGVLTASTPATGTGGGTGGGSSGSGGGDKKISG